ncbi:alpha/beta hydrolase family protein [Arthrobacter sp. NPDC097144]|uniref:alpha/beta hydrolase family protein n=1 Tax=Arthrobacter sp. NPDC097144 TaxID=3363946 RepID=UPI00381A881C
MPKAGVVPLMVRPLPAALAAVLGAVCLPAAAGSIIRAKVTDAGPGQRLVPIRGHGNTGTQEYLDFDPSGFGAHPGRLSMRAASGGELVVLGPPAVGQVARRMVERGSAARIIRDGRGRLSGHLGETPADFGVAAEDAVIQGLPAWVIAPPSSGSTDVWVIHVHGLGSSRSQCLRGVAAFTALGYTSLLPAYRTSLDLSPAPGRSHLGASEWKDIEAARRYALDHGARRILFAGWSLGASIVLRTVEQLPAESTPGVLLISPALDWPGIIAAQLRRAGCPGFLARRLPHTVNLVRPRGEPVLRWQDMPGTPAHKPLNIPTLILHGTQDRSVPVELSRAFVSRHSRSAELVEFEGAHHTLEWNSAPEVWNAAVQSWCRKLELGGSLPAAGPRRADAGIDPERTGR